jgi:phage terminase small subunit
MTPKQQRFVEEYLIDLNATQAAIRAGYSAKTANEQGARLLANVSVRTAVTEAKAKRSEEAQIDAAYVLRQAVKLHERCMQEISPVTDRKGQQVLDEQGRPVFEFNALGASKALELVGKHVSIQAFKDKIEHSGAVTISVASEDAAL